MDIKRYAKSISVLVVLACILPLSHVQSAFSETADTSSVTEATKQEVGKNSPSKAFSYRKMPYDEYIDKYKNSPLPEEEKMIYAVDYSDIGGMQPEVLNRYMGSDKECLKTGDEGFVEWEVDVQREGLYNIAVKYYPLEGKSSAIEREIWIDGEIPFEGARSILFPRLWMDGKSILQDQSGNEYRPAQVEKPEWLERPLSGTIGFYDDSYKFYFSKGKHKIRFYSVKEPMLIEYIKLYQEEEVPSYKDVLNKYKSLGYESASSKVKMMKIQGEKATIKSDPTLYPVEDHTSPINEPYSVSKIRLNTMGGMNWRYPKQWIVWDFDVEEDGLYKIGFRAKQNFKSGIFASRRIYIDEKVPFKEAERIKFNYNMGWQMVQAGEEEPYLFYLTKGKHQIKMEVVLGDLGEILRSVEQSVVELNYIYRKILMITGTVPDPFRDYSLEKQIPECMDIFKRQSEILLNVSKRLAEITGDKGEESVQMEKTAGQLKGFIDNPDTIPERLDKFNSNISALGMWILTASEQPLTIDYIVIAPPEAKLPKAEVSWFSKLVHEVKAFLLSFVEDYNVIGDSDTKKDSDKNLKNVTLWIGATQGSPVGQGGGRDQAQVIKSLVDNVFTPETGIKVDLRLVDMSILLRAVAAGKGPDMAIYQDQSIPVNYALRSALQDLTIFPDIDEVLKRFAPSAVEPFKVGNSVYALPEQQWFEMMFYRKDVLADLGVQPPNTWDDVYELMPVLQKNHMEIGLPTPVNTSAGGPLNSVYMQFLYQRGGEIYNKDKSRCILDNDVGIEAFIKWTELYTKYKVPLKMDMITRFRVGEAPIIISPYTFYNSLAIAAPEIRGLWEMAPIPGTKQQDGSIKRDVSSYVYGTTMFKNARDKDATWEFMKWWTRSDMQVRYGREMEALQGPSARWPTANLDAMWKLPWPTKDANSIREQWKWVKAIPEVPGGYFTGRNIDNAIRTVINNGENPRETLLDYVEIINDEMIIKRKEFRME